MFCLGSQRSRLWFVLSYPCTTCAVTALNPCNSCSIPDHDMPQMLECGSENELMCETDSIGLKSELEMLSGREVVTHDTYCCSIEDLGVV